MLGSAFVIVCAGGAPDDRKEAGASRHEHKYEKIRDTVGVRYPFL